MPPIASKNEVRRYQSVHADKAEGATYTPLNLARFVAERIIENVDLDGRSSISILDPAIGDGELALVILKTLADRTSATLKLRGVDTDAVALVEAEKRIRAAFPTVKIDLTCENFLEFALSANDSSKIPSLFGNKEIEKFDLIIANPPYVRTQIMGSEKAQQLASAFELAGRVDLYQAFLLGMAKVLAHDGAAGIIVSNRFMTTKGGGGLRAALRKRFDLREIWDLGDTKLFSAAVLPAVLIARGTESISDKAPNFTSIYEVKGEPIAVVSDPIEALRHDGVVRVQDGRCFSVRHGTLSQADDSNEVWRLIPNAGDDWIITVDNHTWKRFGDVGKIRVGVKTCADKIFIRHDWEAAFGASKPELLRPLTTHHGAGRFRATVPKNVRSILYPHQVVQGIRQAIPLENFPNSHRYLESHRSALEGRSYVIEAGRRWYEIWVPQDPEAWSAPKLVFRDISEQPTFWVDLDGTVVNGDCYWFVPSCQDHSELLWLAAAVANSTFAEAFYDHRFNNKLYAGRRRFITQYVEQFPLPDPTQPLSIEIIECAKAIYKANHSHEVLAMEQHLDKLVWRAFGLG